ncbi:MAG: RNA methyltransferase [Candidatus Hodarchaeota archaeon]
METPSTTKKIEQDPLWNSLHVVLIEPSKPQNLGSVARVMMNFGFNNLVIVNPKLDLADPEIEIVSRRANHIINQAQLITSMKEVREKLDYLIGTTARVGNDYNLNRVAISPEQLVEEELKHEKLGFIFGREQYGLSNEEIALCDLIISIPTHEAYPAMNLSHAVAIILYFMFQKYTHLNNINFNGRPKHRAASYEERQQLMVYYDNLVKNSGYHPEKHQVALQAFSNIISRGYVTGREITTLMGVLKWIELNLKKKSA